MPRNTRKRFGDPQETRPPVPPPEPFQAVGKCELARIERGSIRGKFPGGRMRSEERVELVTSATEETFGSDGVGCFGGGQRTGKQPKFFVGDFRFWSVGQIIRAGARRQECKQKQRR